MYVGALTLDVLLGDVRSLKQKRSAVASIIAEVRRRQPGVAVAETGRADRYRRTEIGVAVVSSTAAHAAEVLQACERVVAARPEIAMQTVLFYMLQQGAAGAVLDAFRRARGAGGEHREQGLVERLAKPAGLVLATKRSNPT